MGRALTVRRRQGRSECPTDPPEAAAEKRRLRLTLGALPAEDTPIDGSAVGVELLFVGLVIVSSA